MEDKYIGSVKFFKHLIIFLYLLFMCLPTILVLLYYENNEKKLIVAFDEALEEAYEENSSNIVGNSEIETLELLAIESEENNIQTTDYPNVDFEAWNLILVNSNNPLPDDFECELVSTYSGKYVDARIKDSLEEMMDAAIAAGYDVTICSAYRSDNTQWELIQEGVLERIEDGYSAQDAYADAILQLNNPGTSEHSTGLAVDIVGRNHQTLDYEQSLTDEAKWFEEHCAEYGFILRYPEGEEDWTGINFESWHYRYVGIEVATYIMEKGITLEEFILTAPDELYWEEEDEKIPQQNDSTITNSSMEFATIE